MHRSAILPRTTDQTINRTLITTIVTALKEAQPLDSAYHRALDRAAHMLAIGVAFDLRGDVLTIASERTRGQSYTVTIDGCECEAAYNDLLCKHRAALTILLSLQTIEAAAAALVAQPRVTRRIRSTTSTGTRVEVRRIESGPVYTPPRPRFYSDDQYRRIQQDADDLY